MSIPNLNYSKAVCVLSGGMDSTTLLYKMKNKFKEVKAISFNYGQKHSKELGYAVMTCKKLGISHYVVDMYALKDLFKGSSLTSDIPVPEGHYEDENMKITVVPNRNMVLLSLAIAYAISNQFGVVGYGAHAGDHAIYPDCRISFVKKLQSIARIAHFQPIKLYVPYIKSSKKQIVEDGTYMGVDYALTWSCYKGGTIPCGKCGTCVEREEAFRLAKIQDPLTYLNISC